MRAIGLSVLLLAVPAGAQTEPSPVPTSMPEGPASAPSPVPTDSGPKDDSEVTRKALAAITYKDCGKGGPGKILVTFAKDGTVERVVLAEGTWDPAVAVCVTRRFMDATIPAFEGASRTVKWSVVLEGAAPPAATYVAPPAYAAPPPSEYPVRYGGDVLPADDGPPPYGYHVEQRLRSGLLVSGTVISAMGLVFGFMGFDDSGARDDREAMQAVSLVHLAVGIPLLCVGLTKKRVFVADKTSISLAPTVTKTGATFGLSLQF